MTRSIHILAGVAFAAMSSIAAAQAVGVSWSNFQEERWKTDEKAIKDQLAKLGGSYVSADAGDRCVQLLPGQLEVHEGRRADGR